MATNHIGFTSESKSSTLLYARNACFEDSRLLASPTYRPAVRGLPNLDPPASEDDDDIIAALQQSGRVSSINLTVTNSLLEKLSVISEPLSSLEELVLFSWYSPRLCLPSTFRWGLRLRTLHSTRIAFPSFPQLLSPCQELVDLQLREIPNAGYFSPEEFADALSGMTKLRSLSLHFLALPPHRNYLSLPPSTGDYIVIPSLTRLKYRGSNEYLDSFLARIEAPRLENIDITVLSRTTIDASQLGRFIERTEMQTSLDQADVEASHHFVSISLFNSRTSSRFRLQISCTELHWQLSCMAQIFNQFSSFLFRVTHLDIIMGQSPSGYWRDDEGDEQSWLDLVLPFCGAEELRVAGGLASNILRALYSVDSGNAVVLPSLRYLRVEDPGALIDPWDALPFPQRLSSHPGELRILCNICNNSFTRLQELKTHHEITHLREQPDRMNSVFLPRRVLGRAETVVLVP